MSVVQTLQGKHVLFLLAHCDDEVVCGWPVFQLRNVRKTVLVASSDRLNPSRQWCAHRKFAFYDVCRRLGASADCLDFDSDFYKTSQREGGFVRLQETLLGRIDGLRPFDYIFTHNPHGEYGHLDHKFLFDLALNYVPEPLLISDLVMTSNWTSARQRTGRLSRAFYGCPLGDVWRDAELYGRVEAEYRRHGVWTWNEPPADRATVHLLA